MASDLSVSHLPTRTVRDRLQLPAEIRLDSLGVRIGIRANTRELLDQLLSHVAFEWKEMNPGATERRYSVISVRANYATEYQTPRHSLFANGRLLVQGANWEELWGAFCSDLEIFVASRSRRFLFVHAGAVSFAGKAIIIPGPSNSGKTTLVKALIQAGASYFSDEFALLDSSGYIHPFPRPLAIRHHGAIRRITAAQLGAPQACVSAPIAWVIITRYKRGADWTPRLLSRGQGVLALLQNTVAARRYPALALAALQQAMSQARALEGNRGTAGKTARLILQQVGRETSSQWL